MGRLTEIKDRAILLRDYGVFDNPDEFLTLINTDVTWLLGEVERLREAHRVIAGAVDSAIKKTDQPHRIIIQSTGTVVEGEAADVVHRILTLAREVSLQALTQTREG